jgi:hypothetical protein
MCNNFGHFIRSSENGKKPVITNTSSVVCVTNWTCDCPHVTRNVSEAKLSGKGEQISE